MNREILFRGKRKYNGEWVQGDLWCNPYGKRVICIVSQLSDRQSTTGGVEVIPETVGQYTGLTDKNGNKIFEGDLCLCNRNINDRFDKTVFAIKYDKLIGFYGENEWGGNTISADEFDMCEIVGNIHDNKLEDF